MIEAQRFLDTNHYESLQTPNNTIRDHEHQTAMEVVVYNILHILFKFLYCATWHRELSW